MRHKASEASDNISNRQTVINSVVVAEGGERRRAVVHPNFLTVGTLLVEKISVKNASFRAEPSPSPYLW